MLNIRNCHISACGAPPVGVSYDECDYIGYFQNHYGEQWIFTVAKGDLHEETPHKGQLRGGDIDWEKTYYVTHEPEGLCVRNAETNEPIALNRSEKTWLLCVWETAFHRGRMHTI